MSEADRAADRATAAVAPSTPATARSTPPPGSGCLDGVDAPAVAVAPTWDALRRLAAERAAAIGLPEPRRDEDWRYVDVAPLRAAVPMASSQQPEAGSRKPEAGSRQPAASGQRPATGNQQPATSSQQPTAGAAPATATLRVADGRVALPDPTPRGLTISDLRPDSAIGATWRARWAACLAAGDDVSACWTIADAQSALRLAARGVVDVPLVITNDVDGGAHGLRLVVELAAGAALDLVLLHRVAAAARTSVGIDVVLGPGAALRVEEVQDGDGQCLVHVWARAERDAALTWTTALRGGALVRHRCIAALAGTGGHIDLAGVTALDGSRQAHQLVRVVHRVGPTSSAQLFKNLAADRGRASFDGLVRIERGADGSDAQQANRNLLLSPQARIDTRPQLDIHADDVKAGHGATVGRPDPDELFYLRSRGLDAAAAQALLLRGFTGEVLSRFRQPQARAAAERAVRG